MPITLIECFSVGAIPLCTPVGGIINMIQDGENGFLARSSNQEDIEQILKRFLELKNETIAKIKNNSLKTFERFNMQHCCQQYITTINQL